MRGQNGIWMVIIGGIIAVVVIFVVAQVITGGINKGGDAYESQFDAVGDLGDDDCDGDGIPDVIDREIGPENTCNE